jgi:hypothetical protein
MAFGTITSTENTFGSVDGTTTGVVPGTLTGSVGVPGPAGPGVPTGGTTGQVLAKIDGTNYNTEWVDQSGAVVWGDITGTLSSQTDLQTALDLKAPLASPALTGVPTAPTAATLTSTTQLATTAFVQQELLSGTANAKNLEVYVRNQTGSTLAAGTIVYINGATGNRPTVTPAQANNDANSAQTFGFTKASIADNGFGFVIVRGELENIDTSALTEGVQLYLSPTTAGTWTTTKPSAPQHLVYVGIVIRAHPTQGVILVAVQNGYELEELHDVAIGTLANNDLLAYESSTDLWKNKTYSALGLLTSADLTGYATESWVTSGFYPLTGNPSSFLVAADIAGKADLASPTFTGVPLSTTAAVDTNTTQIATTAYVIGQGYLKSATASSTYYLQTNPAGYITSAALSGYATESFVTSQGFITSSALTPYLTTATAASTYQTLAGMSSYLTTSTAASTYQTIAGMSSYLTTASAASTYFTIASAANKADLASPTFTGVPAAPTASPGTNTTQVATTAFVTAAIPATATHLQALQFASTTAVAKVADAASQIVAPSVLCVWPSPSNYNGTATSGTGATASPYLTGYFLGSPNAGVAGNARAYHGNIAGDTNYMMWGGTGSSSFNFSRRVSMSFRFSQYPSDANSVTRVLFGKIHGTAVGDLSSRGIGVKYAPTASTYYFYLQVHNGTTLVNVQSSVQYAGGVADLEVVSDGAGNATLYLNGVSVATTTGAPTGASANNATVFAEVESQATTTVRPEASVGRLFVNSNNF